MLDKEAKIYVAGHEGLVGSAIVRCLKAKGYKHIIGRNHRELDLCQQADVARFFAQEQPDYVILAAAKVGGILANNTYRADFIYQNLAIQNNVIHQSFLHGVKKLLFLGSSCIYPKETKQAIQEEQLLTGALEYTNEPYAIAKIAGLKLCESYNLQYGTNFIAVMPTNLYGIHDNFNLETAHVLPALIRKIHLAKLLSQGNQGAVLENLQMSNMEEANKYLAKFGVAKGEVEIWGTGKPRREFLYIDDMAEASIFILEQCDFKDLHDGKAEIRNTHINVGTGLDISIKDLAFMVKEIIGFDGKLYFNTSKPDGTLVKCLDCTKMEQLGWKYRISLEEGINKLYNWYINQI